MKISKTKNGKWLVDYTSRGQRVRRVIGTSKRQAEEVAATAKADILRGTYHLARAKEAVPFEAFAREFLELYSKQNKRSWRRDESSLRNLTAFFKGSLADITGAEIERFKNLRRSQGLAPATVNRELACLKTLFSKAVEWGRLESNPAERVKKFREDNVKERILTDEEARRLLDEASPSLRPALVLALNTGMRKDEILGLRWDDTDTLKGYIYIGGADSKSGRARTVPMNGCALEALNSLPKVGEFVFHNPQTKSRIKDIKTAFKSACRRSKIKGLTFHALRHTAATRMVEAGVDLVTVSKILGHSSIQMTMRYAHPTPENMKRAVEKLGERFEKSRHKLDMVQIPRLVTRSKDYN